VPLFPALGIPTRHCANLSAAVYTVLYDRHAKRVHDGLELSHSTAGDFDEPDHMANAVGITWGGELVAYDANRLRRLLPAKVATGRAGALPEALCQLPDSVVGSLYPVYPHDGDQVPFDLIQHSVRADAQPTVGTADERS
jgi:hypothetical protein